MATMRANGAYAALVSGGLTAFTARVARALGFRYEGMLRQALAGPSHRDDAWIAGLLPGDDRSPVAWPVLDGGLPPLVTP